MVDRSVFHETCEVQPRVHGRVLAAHRREPASGDDPPVRLHDKGLDVCVVEVESGIDPEGLVERAVRVYPQDSLAQAQHDLPIRLHRNGVHIIVRCCEGPITRGAEVDIERTVGMEPAELIRHLGTKVVELSPDQDLAVCLQREESDPLIRRGRSETLIQRAVCVQPSEVRLRRRSGAASEARELAGDDDLPVGLQRHMPDGGVRAGIEALVHGPISVQPRQVVARRTNPLAQELREFPTDQDLAVRLQYQREDRVIRGRVEALVDRAVGVHPSEVIAWGRPRSTSQPGEESPDEDLPVRLKDQAVDRLAADARIEGRVNGLRARDGARREHDARHSGDAKKDSSRRNRPGH